MGIMKARIIHTSFYDSERVLSLSSQSRWLFMYYLTCKGIGLTGAFKWSNIKTQFETGLTTKQIQDAKNELSTCGLVYFYEEWVIVPQTEDKTGYNKGEKTSIAYSKEFDSLPDEIQNTLLGEYPIDTLSNNDDRVSAFYDTPINHKSETINQKSKGESAERGKSAALYRSISDLTEDDFLEIAEQYQVTKSFVLSKLDDMTNWLGATGKKYKNYKSALRNWVKKDAMNLRKESDDARSKQSVIAYDPSTT